MSAVQISRPMRRPEYWFVLAALMTVSICYYGIRAAAVYGLAIVTALLTDLFCLFLRGRTYRLTDLANIGQAIILAMLFPATVPYSVVILSTIFAIAVGAHVLGYRKGYLFPPAIIGYLFALLSWRTELLRFPKAGERLDFFGNQVTLHESFSQTLQAERVLHADLFEVLMGLVYTPMGTGCLLMLMAGLLVLLCRRQVSAWAVLGYILGICISGFLTAFPLQFLFISHMVIFSMVFFVSDPAVMPCQGIPAYVGAAAAGLLTSYLVSVYRIDYAPLIAVMLCCPFWQALGEWEQKYLTQSPEETQEEAAAMTIPDELPVELVTESIPVPEPIQEETEPDEAE